MSAVALVVALVALTAAVMALLGVLELRRHLGLSSARQARPAPPGQLGDEVRWTEQPDS